MNLIVGKKVWFVTIGVLLSCLLIVVLWKKNVFTSFNKPLASVKVESEFHFLDKVTVQQIISPQLNVRFWQLDLAAVKKKIMAMPWVQTVAVRRQWPDSLLINIEEKQPVARWNQNGLVNYDGTVFYPQNIFIDLPLPKLVGPEGRVWEILTKFQEIKSQAKNAGLGIDELIMNERGVWQLQFKNGITAILGKTDLSNKMQRFIKVYKRSLSNKIEQIRSVDMRYYSGFAVSWKQAGTA